MSLTNAKQAADLISLVVDGFDIVSKITANPIDDGAAAVLRAVVETVKRGETGKISLAAAQDALADLKSRLAAQDKSADDALKHNFDPETTGDG